MIWQFILDMLRTPDAQESAHYWLATLIGHFGVGLFLTALLGWAAGVWRAAVIVSVVYLLAWEGAQLALYDADLSDSLVDAAGVACGAFVAAGAWRNRGAAVAAALSVMVAIGVSGIKRRK